MLLYFLKTLFGVESMNSLPSLLFSCTAAMTLVGFNARQIEEEGRGECRLGEPEGRVRPGNESRLSRKEKQSVVWGGSRSGKSGRFSRGPWILAEPERSGGPDEGVGAEGERDGTRRRNEGE